MILDDEQGSRVELRVQRYQFPQLEQHAEDSNWLRIAVDVATPSACWQATDPCLMTNEAAWLALWLDNLAHEVRQDDHIDFLEPNLGFKAPGSSTDTVALQITLAFELAPPWGHRNHRGNIDEPATVAIVVPRAQIARAAADLRADLDRFPPRAGWDDRPPFTPRVLLSHFMLDWLVAVRAGGHEEALDPVAEYMKDAELPFEVRAAQAASELQDLWYVRLVSPLQIPNRRYDEAVYDTLLHGPGYGSMRVSRPIIRPDGSFLWSMSLPFLTDEDIGRPWSQIAWWRELTNYEDQKRFRYVTGPFQPNGVPRPG